jgi:hypothetical protein
MRTSGQLFVLVAAVICAALPGCSGGGAGEPAQSGTGQGSAATPQPPPEAKLRAAQESAIQAMCERLADCALDEARATMSPEEIAKLEPDKAVPQLRAECEEEGMQSALSPRQVTVIQRCVSGSPTCDELNTCLDQARKQQ